MYKNGEIVNINDEEYVIISSIPCNKITYLYLMTMNKPLKVMFAKQIDELGTIEKINSQEEKKYILSRFNTIN